MSVGTTTNTENTTLSDRALSQLQSTIFNTTATIGYTFSQAIKKNLLSFFPLELISFEWDMEFQILDARVQSFWSIFFKNILMLINTVSYICYEAHGFSITEWT